MARSKASRSRSRRWSSATDLITGEITAPGGAAIGPAGVVIAALIKVETGTLAGRQVVPLQDYVSTGGVETFGFAIPFDPALIDPAASYVVSAAIVDGATTYQTTAGVPAITGGIAADGLTVAVVKTSASIPVASPFPSAAPSSAPTASAAPSSSVEPTEAPSATRHRPHPTPTPTPTPTASPTPSPTASPTPVASASPVPPSGTLTGTLDYPESFKLSAGAVAGVALIEGKGKVSSSPIVATQIIDPAGQAPIAFKLTYDPARIDPNAVYTLQAGVFDVDQAWVTAKGIPVITNGAQSNVTVTLTYRPDAAKGEVTGSVTGVGVTLAAGATSMSVILDVDSGQSIGVDLTSPTSLPAPFAIPFSVSDLSQDGTYVVQSEVTSGDQVWANAAGVPVITKGNPLTGVQVVVSEVVQPRPSPSPTPIATPAPTPPPAEGGRLDGGTLLLPIIVIVALIAIGGFLLARSKDEEPPAPPTEPSQAHPDPSLAGAAAVAGATTAEAATPPPLEAAPPLDAAETAALFEPAGTTPTTEGAATESAPPAEDGPPAEEPPATAEPDRP